MMFIIKVNNRYLAIKGIVLEGGNSLEIRSKKTTRARRIEMMSVIFSPASAGSIKTQILTKEISIQGIIRLTV